MLPIVGFNPVNRSYRGNRGKVGWWLTLPGLAGGPTWTDLTGRADAVGSPGGGIDRPTSPTRPGGWGHAAFSGSGMFALPDLSGRFGSQATLATWIRVRAPSYLGDNTCFGFCTINNDSIRTLYPFADGNIYLSIFTNNSRAINGFAITYDTAQWHWLGIATSPGTGNYRAYHNGQLLCSGTGPSSVSAPAGMGIGGISTASGVYFIGDLDDATLWDRALTDQEMAEAYLESSAGYPNALNRYRYV